MIFKGFRFGMLLQIAVGPVCLLVLQTAIAAGFRTAETGVMAVTLVDALFICAAILGIGALFNRFPNARIFLKYFGAVILVLFGLSNILGIFDVNLLPGLNLSARANDRNFFLTMLLLTLSNPLTILFWAGVFSTKLAQENFSRGEVYAFGGGAVLSTLSFLTLVAFAGSLMNAYIGADFIKGLNLAVGLVLVYFGFRTMLSKK